MIIEKSMVVGLTLSFPRLVCGFYSPDVGGVGLPGVIGGGSLTYFVSDACAGLYNFILSTWTLRVL